MPLKNPWTVVGGATTALAIGASGLIFTGGGDDGALRDAINLRDGRPVAAEEAADQSPDGFEVVPNPVIDAGNSPLDSPGQTNNTPDDSPGDQAPPPAPAPADSPDDSPAQAPAPAPAPADSPDGSPDDQAPPPAPAPADSPDDSPDFDSVDSPDSWD